MNIMNLIRNNQYLLLFVSIALLIIYLQSPYMEMYPRAIHAWAQSDLYALSKGFLNNGFDLFYPETYTYNKQFPDSWNTAYDATITGGNLPLHQFLIALLMKLLGSDSPLIYRTYVLYFSLLGVGYLIKLTELFKLNIWYSLLVVTFAVFSPVYFYYEANFLTTIPSLALVTGGLYYYFLFLKTEKLGHWHLSICLLGIAVITRTTFAIPLIAVLCHQVLILFQTRTYRPKQLISLAIVVIAWWAQMVHFRNVSEEYGSVFLMGLRPVDSAGELWNLIFEAAERWKWDYFSINQWIVYGLIAFAGCIFIRRKNIMFLKGLGYFLLILFIGNALFLIFMIKQFPYHDYYFLDTMYLIVILSIIAFLSIVPKFHLKLMFPLAAGVLYFFVSSKKDTTEVTWNRYHYLPEYDYTTRNGIAYMGSKEFIDSVGIDHSAKIAVLGNMGANIPFLLMDRKGYAIDYTNQDVYHLITGWGMDYIIVPDYLLEEDIVKYPYVLKNYTPIATNSKISVFKRDLADIE